MSEDLRKGWGRVKIGEIAEVFLGKTPARRDYDSSGKLKIIKFRDLRDNRIDFTIAKDGFVIDNSKTPAGLRELRIGDVLMTSAAHSGENIGKKAAYVSELPSGFDRIFFTGELLNVRCGEGTIGRWLYFFFRSADGLEEIQNAVKGVHLTSGRAKEMIVPLAPLDEQSRIVAKLEKLLSRAEAAQAQLGRIPGILKRFRQSVHVEACSGRLTAEWRKKQRHLESAAALLQELDTQGESKDFRGNGSSKQPVSLREYFSVFFDLPGSWAVTNFGSVVSSIRGGSTAVPANSQTDFPILRSSSVRPGLVDLEDVKYLSSKASQNHMNYLSEGDLLFTRLSGSLDYVANCAKVRGLKGRRVQYPDRLFCAKVITPINSSYCELVFAAHFVRSQVIKQAKSSAGHQRVSIVNITDQLIPIPPLAEQQEIVRRVEALFKTADALEARYLKAKAHVDKLTQSILAKAFRGELVSQDPKDEPASVLLSRIHSLKDQSITKCRGK